MMETAMPQAVAPASGLQTSMNGDVGGNILRNGLTHNGVAANVGAPGPASGAASGAAPAGGASSSPSVKSEPRSEPSPAAETKPSDIAHLPVVTLPPPAPASASQPPIAAPSSGPQVLAPAPTQPTSNGGLMEAASLLSQASAAPTAAPAADVTAGAAAAPDSQALPTTPPVAVASPVAAPPGSAGSPEPTSGASGTPAPAQAALSSPDQSTPGAPAAAAVPAPNAASSPSPPQALASPPQQAGFVMPSLLSGLPPALPQGLPPALPQALPAALSHLLPPALPQTVVPDQQAPLAQQLLPPPLALPQAGAPSALPQQATTLQMPGVAGPQLSGTLPPLPPPQQAAQLPLAGLPDASGLAQAAGQDGQGLKAMTPQQLALFQLQLQQQAQQQQQLQQQQQQMLSAAVPKLEPAEAAAAAGGSSPMMNGMAPVPQEQQRHNVLMELGSPKQEDDKGAVAAAGTATPLQPKVEGMQPKVEGIEGAAALAASPNAAQQQLQLQQMQQAAARQQLQQQLLQQQQLQLQSQQQQQGQGQQQLDQQQLAGAQVPGQGALLPGQVAQQAGQPALPAGAAANLTPAQQQLLLQQQQQQQLLLQQRRAAQVKLNGGWQSNNDIPARRKILGKIVNYLQQRKPQARPEWSQKVPQMAKRLEDSLYRCAATFDEYADMNTLRHRLQQLALKLGNKAKLQSQTPGQEPQGGAANGGALAQMNGVAGAPHLIPASVPQQGQLQRQGALAPQAMMNGVSSDGSLSNASLTAGVAPGASPAYANGPTANGQGPGASIMSSGSSGSLAMAAPKGQVPNGALDILGGNAAGAGQPLQAAGADGQARRAGVAQQPYSPEQRRAALRQQQQRLLLLRHASKCPHGGDGVPCSVTPHCAGMKKLWKHIAECKDQHCRVPHCVSSRFVLSHYHRCKDAKCAVCAPVREVIQKSHQRSLAMVRQRELSQAVPSGPVVPTVTPGTVPASLAAAARARSIPLTEEQLKALTDEQRAIFQRRQQQQQQLMQAALTAAKLTPQQQQQLTNIQRNEIFKRYQIKLLQQQHLQQQARQQEAAQQQAQQQAAAAAAQQAAGAAASAASAPSAPVTRGKLPRRGGNTKSPGAQGVGLRSAAAASSGAGSGLGTRSSSEAGLSQSEPSAKRQRTNAGKSASAGTTKAGGASSGGSNTRPGASSSGAGGSQTSATVPPRPTMIISGQPGRPKTERQGITSAEEVTSLVEAFRTDEIQAHLQSLSAGLHLTPQRIKQYCTGPLAKLEAMPYAWVFKEPVNPEKLNLPDYFTVVKRPMDLGTIRKRLDQCSYRNMEDFATDVDLVFDNAIMYNGPSSEVAPVAEEMKATFHQEWNVTMQQLNQDEEQRKNTGEACSLCGLEKLNYEPMTYYCNGEHCSGGRIRRNSHFYAGNNNQYHLCIPCFNDLRDNVPIQLGDVVLHKKDLVKKKNDELVEEPWVECDQCKKWVHQICGLFNTRQNTHDQIPYLCPHCVLANREKSGNPAPTANKFGGKDLRHTRMSEFIEKRVLQLLERLYTDESARLNVPVESLEKGGRLHIRQVSAQDVKHIVRPGMARRYRRRGPAAPGVVQPPRYPEEFPARSKCVLLFQDTDGVDVLLFGMYVYEYGHTCPEPNSRRVYISYLDSVHYFKPRRYRTEVYHEILVAYLEYVKTRGFHTAHLWACPPLKGDDYILYCHPEDQKTPKDDRLQSWYITMLQKAQKRGIVEQVTNLYDEYWIDSASNAMSLPYFEGDYWVGEAENIIKEMEEEGINTVAQNLTAPSQNSASSQSKGRTASKRQAVRAAERLRMIHDELMQRLGDIIEPMKQGFIVAYLRDRDFAKQCQERRRREVEIENAQDLVRQAEAAQTVIDPAVLALSREPIAVDETAENEEEAIDCESLDSRQQFLNLCQGNHYQFDQLRRAKHSSMMVLYHLCNPDAPKFLSTCSSCLREISAGTRYTCSVCDEYNLCQECYSKLARTHPHPLKGVPVRQAAQPQMTDQQRRERQRSIQLHMQLLQHASTCQDPSCPSQNCNRMKGLLTHGATCQVRTAGGCSVCRRIWALLQIHARQCKRSDCNVPKCQQLREHLRQLALQQQQMDDRRRQAMNDFRTRTLAGGATTSG